jgi:cystathionine beta-lyase
MTRKTNSNQPETGVKLDPNFRRITERNKHLNDGRESLRTATRLVTTGRHPEEQFGFINPPVYHGSTVLYPDVATLRSREQRYVYGLRGNPTADALEDPLTELEGAAGTVLTNSGLSAISIALLTVVESGGHILVPDSCYQPARMFCDHALTRLGIETEYYDPLIGAGIADLIRPNTQMILLESPGSQTFDMQDIPAIVDVAKAHDVCTVVDNTWATPLYFPALKFGCDITLMAGTKYIVGHSDALLGTISANEKWWPRLRATFDVYGVAAGPDDQYLGQRGIRTMHVRLAHHMKSAIEMANWFETRSEVARVMHPALKSHPRPRHLEARLHRLVRAVFD